MKFILRYGAEIVLRRTTCRAANERFKRADFSLQGFNDGLKGKLTGLITGKRDGHGVEGPVIPDKRPVTRIGAVREEGLPAAIDKRLYEFIDAIFARQVKKTGAFNHWRA